jgi:FKBP-type peptidyl-prolyl cis-trans isomerase
MIRTFAALPRRPLAPAPRSRCSPHFVRLACACPSGVTKEVLVPGDGAAVKIGNAVTVHCTGFGKGGDLAVPFWSTRDPGQKPFTFKLGAGEVISAWDAGVSTMRVGETAAITAVAEHAYGGKGYPKWGILPGSTLRFEIEVLRTVFQPTNF